MINGLFIFIDPLARVLQPVGRPRWSDLECRFLSRRWRWFRLGFRLGYWFWERSLGARALKLFRLPPRFFRLEPFPLPHHFPEDRRFSLNLFFGQFRHFFSTILLTNQLSYPKQPNEQTRRPTPPPRTQNPAQKGSEISRVLFDLSTAKNITIPESQSAHRVVKTRKLLPVLYKVKCASNFAPLYFNELRHHILIRTYRRTRMCFPSYIAAISSHINLACQRVTITPVLRLLSLTLILSDVTPSVSFT